MPDDDPKELSDIFRPSETEEGEVQPEGGGGAEAVPEDEDAQLPAEPATNSAEADLQGESQEEPGEPVPKTASADGDVDPLSRTAFALAVEDMFKDIAGQVEPTKTPDSKPIEQVEPATADELEEDTFFLAVKKMFQNLRACAMEQLHAMQDAGKRTLAQLQDAESRLEKREEEVKRLLYEVDAEKNRVLKLEAEMAALREEFERQAAEMADNDYLDELTDRLNEAYNVLAAIEEAYLVSEVSEAEFQYRG